MSSRHFRADGRLVNIFEFPSACLCVLLHSPFSLQSNTIIPSTPVLTTVLLRWNVSPKLPLASSVKQGNDTKYKNGGLYMIYRVTELLKIHDKFSGKALKCTSSLPLFQRNKQTHEVDMVWWNGFWLQCHSSVKWSACYVGKDGGSLFIVCTKKLGHTLYVSF